MGMVIVVGGPQYRIGSHRQFVLLARALANRGIAVLRFDCRGMGDSDGEFPGFEQIQPDVAAAVDLLTREVPTLRKIILWGLCDATLAMSIHARRDPRIAGVVLVNPWVRSESELARAHLRHYYLSRLTQREFLGKVLKGEFDFVASARSFWGNLIRALASRERPAEGGSNPLAQRLAHELKRFDGRILIILSGRDLTAKEFELATRGSIAWRTIYREKRVTRMEMAAADHTFSRREWRDQVANWTWEWMNDATAP
jgi:exosortase A-associated hydrolase 1